MRPESMRMYQAAEALTVEIDRLWPKGKAALPNTAVHLAKSIDSVLFNMGEGIGCFAPKAKIAAYSISRKEANEIRAALHKCVIVKVYRQRDIQKAYDLAGSVVGMLTAAIITIEKRLDQ